MNTYFIIDFDSTLIQVETLDFLATIVLQNHPKKDDIVRQIEEVTRLGMEGQIDFGESLKRRLKLLTIEQKHLEEVKKMLLEKITPSFARNKSFFQKHKEQIYIVSGGFKELILPVAHKLSIAPSHVLANEFVIKEGKVTGVDRKNPLSKKGGKAKAVAGLNLDGEIYVIGDGMTDWEIVEKVQRYRPAGRQGRGAKVQREESKTNNQQPITNNKVTFVAFTENVFRESVVAKADYSVPSFDEFLYKYGLAPSPTYTKKRLGVLLLENIHEKAVYAFEKAGYSVQYFEKAISQEELLKTIPDVTILGIRSRTQVTKEVLRKADKLLGIGAFCIGTEQIDLGSAKQKGIAVFNAPYSNTRSVVELALGEIIMLSRGIFDKSNKLHAGIWDKSATGSVEIRGKTLGIVGYGSIGSQLSVLAESLGMNVVFYDIVEKLALGNARKAESLEELLRISDIVTIHVDGREENKNFIGEKAFTQMKDGVVFLNLSRGKIVDIQALHGALQSGKVKGAALDVYPEEPEGNTSTGSAFKDDPIVSRLQGLPQAILTPHIGGSTKEAQENIGEYVSKKLIEYIESGSTYLSNTIPQIQAPLFEKGFRLAQIHANMPGMLAKLNSLLAREEINVLGQYLKTDEQIGYVVTDTEKKVSEKLLMQINSIEGSIKARIL
jgi:D-3-phosphoglycerate dehydrogenase